MKNQMELLQAAQKSAAASLTIATEIDLVKAKAEAFDACGISKEHYAQFSAYFDSSRAAYVSLINVPVTAAE